MIELVGVTFAHAGAAPLFEEASLAVAAGEVVLVSAPAGAGASTLARLLAGRLTAAGRVAVHGRDVARLRASSRTALRRRFGVVPQELALVDDRSALANVALALEIDGVPRARRRHRAAEALRAVDAPAEPDAPAVSALPMAARQRVAWARAFVRNPDLLIADQPTSHQDADGAERFAALTDELAAAGAACIVLAREPHLVAAAARRDWRTLTIHQRRLVDVAALLADDADGAGEIDASLHVIAEIERLDPDNIVPFPVVRSASGGHRG